MQNRRKHVSQLVDGYWHNVLSAQVVKTVEEHCERCADCRDALEQANQRHDALPTLPTVEASVDLIQRTEARIDDYRRRKAIQTGVAWSLVGASFVVLLSLDFYFRNLMPSPYEVRLLGQTVLIPDTDASLRVVLLNRDTGQPLAEVPVEIALESAADGVVKLAEFRTDEMGTGRPRFHLPDWNDGEYQLRVRATPFEEEDEIVRTVQLRRLWQVMLSTDKPVYQPGQVILLRSQALKLPHRKPEADGEMLFTISDPKGNIIFRRRSTTSKFGIAAAECPLATEIIEGQYRIDCEIEGTHSTKTVEVKQYVLPKFKLAVALDAPYYQPGDVVRGTVSGKYFFGEPVAGGKMRVRVQSAGEASQLVNESDAICDEQGFAAFEFTLPERFGIGNSVSTDTQLEFVVTVEDSAGQRHEAQLARVVTANPIQIEVIQESERLVRESRNTVYVLARYSDGSPAKARISVTGPDRKQELQTDHVGVAAIELTPYVYEVPLTVKAVDEQGRRGSRAVTLYCDSPSRNFLIRTDRAVYEGGQTAQLSTVGGGDGPVFIDLLKEGQTVLTDVFETVDGQGRYALDLPPELSGVLELTALRFDEQGRRIRQTRLIYVRPAGELNIAVQLDRDSYRPGETARLTLDVTDPEGRPAPGAVSLAAVDEAVFSVLGLNSALSPAYSPSEQRLLNPVFELASWSPKAVPHARSKSWNRYERVLFAQASQKNLSGRQALRQQLSPYLEESTFDVLDRPDWEQFNDSFIDLPAEAVEALKQDSAQHSLYASTYPANVQRTQLRRSIGLKWVKSGWLLFAVIGGIAGLFWLYYSLLMRRFVEALIVVVIVCLLIGLMLPSLSHVREASRRVSARNRLTQIGMALVVSQDRKSDQLLTNSEGRKGGQPRVRRHFPETLLWKPELITDDDGRVSIDVDLADSITSWRLTAAAVTSEGRLGATDASIRVFQPFFVDFNLPVALTRGDEVTVPVVVYNYLEEPQTVELQFHDADWFEPLDQTRKTVELKAGEVGSVGFRLRSRKVGRHQLQVTAHSGDVSDAIQRAIEVQPGGQRVEQVVSGVLDGNVIVELKTPPEMIEGSLKSFVKIYPSSFSQTVEGLDAIFKRPYGCFEQTSSTTYPNILALNYLRQAKKSAPAIEKKSQQYIHLGYQRLLGFEVAGGGFDWFGNPPAHRTLSAYGLMEFQDMAAVYDVDPAVIERTREWLLSQRKADGTWESDHHHLVGASNDRQSATLAATAYISWAVFGGGAVSGESQQTTGYLLSHPAETIDDPYLLALVCNALWAVDGEVATVQPYLDRLHKLRRSSADGKLCWWEKPDARTMFFGSGQTARIETTALATLALLSAHQHAPTTRAALSWLVEQMDRQGTWQSTQATVLALKALIAGTGKPLGGDGQRQFDVVLNGETVKNIALTGDQTSVMQRIDLSEHIATGSHQLTLTRQQGPQATYQVVHSYHVPNAPEPIDQQPLAIDVAYNRRQLAVNDVVSATATISNRQQQAAPMVIVELPIPAGFHMETERFANGVTLGQLAKFQVQPTKTVLYLRDLPAGQTREFNYRLRALLPVKTNTPPPVVYEYYSPEKVAVGNRTQFTARR